MIMQTVPFQIPVIVTSKQNCPAIELRRLTTDIRIIKPIISAAFHSTPIMIIPTFSDKMKSLNTLIEKGIIYKDKENYFFVIDEGIKQP